VVFDIEVVLQVGGVSHVLGRVGSVIELLAWPRANIGDGSRIDCGWESAGEPLEKT
jgi:hypothetical protein